MSGVGTGQARVHGPLSLQLVGCLLGKNERAVKELIELEKLPVVRVATTQKQVDKVYFTPLLRWINERAVNSAMTADDLEEEILRCQRRLAAKRQGRVDGRLEMGDGEG